MAALLSADRLGRGSLNDSMVLVGSPSQAKRLAMALILLALLAPAKACTVFAVGKKATQERRFKAF